MKRTHPEIFIIEFLRPDEMRGKSDGFALKTILSFEPMRAPHYEAVTSRTELRQVARKFREGNYRWLHLSCHGDTTGFELHGEDDITFHEFAEIFSGLLNKRRQFVSACEVGVRKFAKAIFKKNPECWSVAAPRHGPRFDESALLWTAFYFLMWKNNPQKMTRKGIRSKLKALGKRFPPTIRYFVRDNDLGALSLT